MNYEYRKHLTATGTLRHLTTIFFALILCACSTQQVGSDHDPGTNFSTYKTFTLMQRSHKELTPSDMKDSTQPIQNAVASVLARFPPA
jgi:thiaminase